MNTLATLIGATTQPHAQDLEELGIQIGKLYTNQGLPVDMALASLPHSQEQKLSILDGVCQWLVEHKRLSGAPEKAIERQRSANVKLITDFLQKGETGAY
jgi:hypothetical protein